MKLRDRKPKLERKSRFTRIKDKIGIEPKTVWDIDRSDTLELSCQSGIGDGIPLPTGEYIPSGREKSGDTTAKYRRSKKAHSHFWNDDAAKKAGSSIFSPTLTDLIFDTFAPKTGRVYDCCGGEFSRGLFAEKYGLEYIGLEIREEQVEAWEKLKAINAVSDNVQLLHGSSTNASQIPDNSADFAIVCPPYFDMEPYSELDEDVSNTATYRHFLMEMRKMIKECYRILKPGSLACWVVGLHRNKRKGSKKDTGFYQQELICIPHDIARLHRKAGFFHKEEIIINWRGTGSQSRYGQFSKGNGFLIRSHEYLEVFVKPQEAKTKKPRRKGASK